MVGAGVEDALDGVVFGLGDPEVVFVFDVDLAGDELATEGAMGGEPRGGVVVAFLHVCYAVDGEEVEGVVVEGAALLRGELLSAFLPGVAEGDDVVDVDCAGGFGAADEVDDLICVGAMEGAGEDETAVENGVGEVALEDDVADVAAVDLAPVAAELVAGIAGARSAAFDWDAREYFGGEGEIGVVAGEISGGFGSVGEDGEVAVWVGEDDRDEGDDD